MNEFSFIVESNAQGELSITIGLKLMLDNYEIEVYDSNGMVDFYFDTYYNEVYINSTIQSNEAKEFLIKLSFN